jgi:hypothetical protein
MSALHGAGAICASLPSHFPADDLGLRTVACAARDFQRDLTGKLAPLEREYPELAAWLRTALYRLETLAQDLALERDTHRRQEGAKTATRHAMRISSGLELAAAMGIGGGDLRAWSDHLAGIVSCLERVGRRG